MTRTIQAHRRNAIAPMSIHTVICFVSKVFRKLPNRVIKSPRPYVAATLTVMTVLAIVWVFDRSEQERFRQKQPREGDKSTASTERPQGGVFHPTIFSRGVLGRFYPPNKPTHQ